MLTRRALAGATLTLAAGIRAARAAPPPAIVHMVSDTNGSFVGFDPIGLLIEPGQAVRWQCDANVHTTTAYHPKNANHSLRIPKEAQPWNSDYVMPGKHFEVTFTVPGVYDYFCIPHEMAGMVGRIIVGHPAGPGTLPFDYFLKLPNPPHWMTVPEAAQKAFPAIAAIMQRHSIPLPHP